MTSPTENAVRTGLISPAGLAELLAAPSGPISLLDASYGQGFAGHPPRAVFEALRIGDAQFFDIDEVADPASPLAHTLPPAGLFGRCVGELGVGNDHLVVVYDQTGIALAAARAWWMFRVFGHTNVCVLDGGLPAWRNAGLEITEGPAKPPLPQSFSAISQNDYMASHDRILAATTDEGSVIVDVRPSLHSGQIPGSHHLPAGLLLDPATRGLASPDMIKEALGPLTAAPSARIISTCGSGVMACVLALALHRAGHRDYSVYDGSWAEWSQKELLL